MSKVQLSVIVPNYNYGCFLERRLKSIINQTIKPSEIIFLDDCSTDNSIEIADEILKKSGIHYQIIKNQFNQGVFRQWLNGISLAKYSYIWIAEADDSCKLSFLESLLPAFDDPDAVLSYCQSRIISDQYHDLFRNHKDNLRDYFDISRWDTSYINSCYDEASKYLSVISTIANASAVIFNKDKLPLAKLQQILDYKMAGDWLFYLLLLFENPKSNIHYCAQELNFWYRHASNIWADVKKGEDAYTECLKIYSIILTQYQVGLTAKKKIYNLLVKHYLNRYIKNKDYNKLLFKIIDMTESKSILISILQIVTQIQLFKTVILHVAKLSSAAKHKLKSLLM